MKKTILLLTLLFSANSFSQYCAFFDFKAEEPEMVVSTVNAMMQTEWAKNIEGTKTLLAYQFRGEDEATHSVQFCFPNETALANFSNTWNASPIAQLIGEKLNNYITPVRQVLNTPAWFKNDWGPDQVFMIWEMEVSDPATYVKEFASFSQKAAKDFGYENNSYGVGYPISGKGSDFSHFVWVGSPDLESTLTRTKQMYASPDFAKYSEKVSGIRKVVNTYLLVRLQDY